MLPIFVILLFVSRIILSGADGKRIPQFAGSYRVVVKRVTNVSEEFTSTGEIWAKLYFTQQKLREKQYVWGWTYIGTEINDNMKFEVRMSLWANNQWKKNAFVMKFDHACTNLLKHASAIVDYAFGAEGKKCPLPAIKLTNQGNRTWEFKFPTFPVLPYGRYSFNMGFLRAQEVVGVVVADVEIAPKV